MGFNMKEFNKMVRQDINKLIKEGKIICEITNYGQLTLSNINFINTFNFIKNIVENKEDISIRTSNTDISNIFYTNDDQQINIYEIKEITFTNCTFNRLPTIKNDNIWLLEFENCKIKACRQIVSLLSSNNQNKRVYFNNCELDYLEFGGIHHIQYNSDIKLCYFEINGGNIPNLTIKNIELASKLYINRQNNKSMTIENLIIRDSIFKENFNLHNCEVKNVSINDTDFEKQFDCYKSTFNISNDKDKTIYFKNLNIKGLFIFDNVTFYQKVKFEYVTFESSGNFRYSTFKKGVDLDTINIQEDKVINFYGVKELEKKYSKQETSQETYRIIKHNFEKLGNRIESNKYYALELMKRKHNLPKYSPNKWSLLLHQGSSNFSQWWLLTLFWIFITSFLTAFIIHHESIHTIYSNIITFNTTYIIDGLLKMLHYMSIINVKEKFREDHFEIFILNKLALGYLYYQFITSFRKDTRK